jgi:hypothetical protein
VSTGEFCFVFIIFGGFKFVLGLCAVPLLDRRIKQLDVQTGVSVAESE